MFNISAFIFYTYISFLLSVFFELFILFCFAILKLIAVVARGSQMDTKHTFLVFYVTVNVSLIKNT